MVTTFNKLVSKKKYDPYMAYYSLQELQAVAEEHNIKLKHIGGKLKGKFKSKRDLLKEIKHYLPIITEEQAKLKNKQLIEKNHIESDKRAVALQEKWKHDYQVYLKNKS